MRLLHKKALAECLGTFFLVFAGCGALMVAERFPGTMPPGSVALVFGLVVAAMVYALGHISGAHLNPAVTLAFAVARHFPRREVALYWTAQFAGAGLAIAFLHVLLPAGATYGATVPALHPAMAVGWEAALTFCLMFVVIAVATDTRAVGTMAGAAVGATVLIDALIGGPVTGASMNPARSLAPAIAEGRLADVWIYFVGPALGAVLAVLTYEGIRCDKKDPETETDSAKGCC